MAEPNSGFVLSFVLHDAVATERMLEYWLGRGVNAWLEPTEVVAMDLFKHSAFLRELLRLNAAQLHATTSEDREVADHDLAHCLRMASMGRLEEYFAARAQRSE